jgi:hypothetical protein
MTSMMNRRAFIVTGAGLLAGPLAAEAQPAGKVARIGWLLVDVRGNPQFREAYSKDCVPSGTSRAATS